MGKCKQCKRTMTWAEVKVQYGRMKRAGLDDKTIKEIQPSCQKCITRWLKENKK